MRCWRLGSRGELNPAPPHRPKTYPRIASRIKIKTAPPRLLLGLPGSAGCDESSRRVRYEMPVPGMPALPVTLLPRTLIDAPLPPTVHEVPDLLKLSVKPLKIRMRLLKRQPMFMSSWKPFSTGSAAPSSINACAQSLQTTCAAGRPERQSQHRRRQGQRAPAGQPGKQASISVTASARRIELKVCSWLAFVGVLGFRGRNYPGNAPHHHLEEGGVFVSGTGVVINHRPDTTPQDDVAKHRALGG